MFEFETYRVGLTNFFLIYGVRVIVALLILIIGWWVTQRIVNLVYRLMVKKDLDPSLRPFLKNILSISLKVFLIIFVISQVGFEVTSFIAVLGSAGLAIGLALQGSLANFAGGVLLLVIKPFKVGDFIEVQATMGKVCQINMFNTVLKTGDNKTIFIPNGPLASSTIINYDVEDTRRVDMRFLIGHENDLQKAKAILTTIIEADARILEIPAPQIVSEFNELQVTLIVRVWSKREDYWGIYWDLMEKVKTTFDLENISRPTALREIINKV